MSTSQYTARTVTAKSGMILPTTINQQTDMNLITTAVTVFYKMGGCKGSFDTVIAVADAMRDSSAVIVLYVALDGEQVARCLWPNSVSITKDGNLVTRAYCTLRREWKTFRLDRMLTCHALTTPDDAEAVA